MNFSSVGILNRVIGFAFTLMAVTAIAAAPGPGLSFNATSPVYEADFSDLNLSQNLSVELWLQPARNCPEGAVIVDKLGPGTKQGIRLEVATGGSLRLITSAPKPVQTEARLATNKPTHIVAVFNSRDKVMAIYLDGKLAASWPDGSQDRFVMIGSAAPLRIGADAMGEHHFVGSISYLAVYNRTLKTDEVAQLDSGTNNISGLVGAWQLKPDGDRKIEPASGSVALVVPAEIKADFSAPANALTLWYPRPAREWLESLPFGNGRLGGTVFGGVVF